MKLSSLIVFLCWFFLNSVQAQALMYQQGWVCSSFVDRQLKLISGAPRIYLFCAVEFDAANSQSRGQCALSQTPPGYPAPAGTAVMFSLVPGVDQYHLGEGRVHLRFSRYIHPFWHQAQVEVAAGAAGCEYSESRVILSSAHESQDIEMQLSGASAVQVWQVKSR